MGVIALAVVGECTAGCGACCRTLRLPVPSWWPDAMLDRGMVPPVDGDADFGLFLAARGLQVDDETGVLHIPGVTSWRRSWHLTEYVDFEQACPQLDEAGLCQLHGTAAYPPTCERYPTVRDDLRVVPSCTYRVEAVER